MLKNAKKMSNMTEDEKLAFLAGLDAEAGGEETPQAHAPEEGQVSLEQLMGTPRAALPGESPGTAGDPTAAGATPQTNEGDTTMTTKTTTPPEPLVRLNPADEKGLMAYAAGLGCTPQGQKRFADAIASERFLTDAIEVIDVTEGLTANNQITLLTGAVLHYEQKTKTNPNPQPRAGFTFADAPQKAIYVRGVVHTQLKAINERGRLRGPAPAQYLVMPETIPGVQSKGTPGTASMGVKLPPYNPILRLLSHIIDDDGLRKDWFDSSIRGAGFDPLQAKAAREFSSELPGFVMDLVASMGLEEDALVPHTTYAEIEENRLQRETNGGRRRGPLVAGGRPVSMPETAGDSVGTSQLDQALARWNS